MAMKSKTGAPPFKVSHQLDLFQQQSLTAIGSLSVAASTAIELGYSQIAQATERVKYVFITEVYNKTVNVISEATEKNLAARVATLESIVAEQLQPQTEPRTQV